MAKHHSAEHCFYCEGLVSTKGRGDHFPLPKRHGGTHTVPCCESCHDMKDRFALHDWPTAWISIVLEQWPSFRRETRLFLAKVLCLCADTLPADAPPIVQPRRKR